MSRKLIRRFRRPGDKRQGPKNTVYKNIARYALKGINFLKSVVNVEKKRQDTQLVNVTTFVPTIALLTGTAQGNDYNQRSGRSIKGWSNSLKYKVALNNTTPTKCMVRMILFNDKNSNGVTPQIQELLDTSLSTDYMLLHYNADNAGSRFKILADKRFQLDPNSYNYHIGSLYHKIRWHCKYDGSTATQADAVSGHIYLMLVSDVVTSPTAPTVSYINRFTYVDN